MLVKKRKKLIEMDAMNFILIVGEHIEIKLKFGKDISQS